MESDRCKVKVKRSTSSTRKKRIEEWVEEQNCIEDKEIPVMDVNPQPEHLDPLFKPMQRQLHSKRISEQTIKTSCEWLGCSYSVENYSEFQSHVKSHLPKVHIKSYEVGEDLYMCSWNDCVFETQCDKELIRHVNFHAYHTRLKVIGVNVHERYCLDKCTRDDSQKNQLPELLSEYLCQWVGCALTFNGIQDFIDHVLCHVIRIDPKADGWYACGWLGCKLRFRTLNKLKPHCRSHTGERVVACYNCGGMFASNAVYEDHCVRQTLKTEEYRCDTCGKLFSSERIMRSHARRHINSYKCAFCDMTSSAPSALIKHIRYRHINYRPFQCQHCHYRSISKFDMHSHQLRHEGVYTNKKPCLEEDSKENVRIYVCHYCENFFNTGHNLTRHLVRIHGYNQASGFLRFRYEQSDDGFYRLMPLRYESLELSKQIMEEENDKNSFQNKVLDDNDFKLIECSGGNSEKPTSFIIVPSSLNDPELLKTIIKEQEQFNASSNETKKTGKKVKKPKKPTGRTPKKKRTRTNSEESPPAKKSTSKVNLKLNINEFLRKKTIKIEPPDIKPKNIELSIAHIDEDGNVIKSEVIESQEIIT